MIERPVGQVALSTARAKNPTPMSVEQAIGYVELYTHRAEIAGEISARTYEDLKFHLDNLYRAIRAEREGGRRA